MRADRLLSILLQLQTRQRMTARELADRLEVSERTIHRDMLALSGAGIPVVAERGIHGGWRLLEGYRTNLTGLKEAEIQALFLTNPSKLLADLGWEQASDTALVKLLAALPTVFRRDAEYVRQRIHIDIGGWSRPEENVACLPLIQEAIWQERKLTLSYQREHGSVERVVDPLGLVAKGSVWYLVAAVEGDLRTYRISRILDAKISEETCTRPADFDLAAYWEQSTSDFVANLPRYPAVLRIHSDLLPMIRMWWRYAKIERLDPPDENGWVEAHMHFDVIEIACHYILGAGGQVEVLDPPELRELVIEGAAAVLKLYRETELK